MMWQRFRWAMWQHLTIIGDAAAIVSLCFPTGRKSDAYGTYTLSTTVHPMNWFGDLCWWVADGLFFVPNDVLVIMDEQDGVL